MEYSARQKPTRWQRFLTDLDRLVPYSVLIALIEPPYYRGERGRPPVGLKLMLMLRMYLCQNCLGLSSEGIEDAIVDGTAVRRIVGVDLIEIQAPDTTTLLKVRRLLERHDMPAFAGSDAGGERAAAIYSLIGTATLNGIDCEAWLHHVTARIADHPINRVEELLPLTVTDQITRAGPTTAG